MPLPEPALRSLDTLVLKTGVGLGGLATSERHLALALASRCIDLGQDLTERAVNEALKAALARELVFLDLDHVELRRWLIDTGLWTRDAYGRAYRRASDESLTAPLRSACALVDAIDPPRWVPERRAAVAADRAARRRAWEAGQGASSGSGARG